MGMSKTYEVTRRHKATGMTVALRFKTERPQDLSLWTTERDRGVDGRMKRIAEDGKETSVFTKETNDSASVFLGISNYRVVTG